MLRLQDFVERDQTRTGVIYKQYGLNGSKRNRRVEWLLKQLEG